MLVFVFLNLFESSKLSEMVITYPLESAKSRICRMGGSEDSSFDPPASKLLLFIRNWYKCEVFNWERKCRKRPPKFFGDKLSEVF
jgi:hypothetical protein